MVAGSRVGLARFGIRAAVRAGAATPDIRTIDGLKQAPLDARSDAFSAQVSAVDLSEDLFLRLRLADVMAAKTFEGGRSASARWSRPERQMWASSKFASGWPSAYRLRRSTATRSAESNGSLTCRSRPKPQPVCAEALIRTFQYPAALTRWPERVSNCKLSCRRSGFIRVGRAHCTGPHYFLTGAR